MADTAHDPMSLGGREALSPFVDDGFVQVDNETHVLNYDTNILNLDDNREVSPGADMDCDSEIPRTSTESVDHEEDADIEVSIFASQKGGMACWHSQSLHSNLLIFSGSWVRASMFYSLQTIWTPNRL